MRNPRLRVIRRGLPLVGGVFLLSAACGDGGTAAPPAASPAGAAGSAAGGASGASSGAGGKSGQGGSGGAAAGAGGGAASAGAGGVAGLSGSSGGGAGGGAAGFSTGTGGSFSTGGAAGKPVITGGSGGAAGTAGTAGNAGNAGGGLAGSAGSGGTTSAGSGGDAGQAGAGGGTSGKPGDPCAKDGDCNLGDVVTNPAGCAEAACVTGVCGLRGVDGDGDGGRTKTCVQVSGEATKIVLGTDCNDADPAVHVGAAEVCATPGGAGQGPRDEDDNCDGQKDEQPAVGSLTYVYDGDGDSYADSAKDPVIACAPPGPGWVTGLPRTDCDDKASSVHPGQPENCATLVDDNCTGSINDGCACVDGVDPNIDCGAPTDCVYLPGGSKCTAGKYTACPAPIGKVEYCPDADLDGSCSATGCGLYCPEIKGASSQPLPPVGYKEKSTCPPATDCADNNFNVGPGKLELCGDGLDNDCTGGLDNGYDIGGPCDRATGLGACLGGGVRACDTSTSVKCNSPQSATIPSAGYNSTAAPNGSFDWNCDGTVEMAVSISSGAACTGTTYVRGNGAARPFCVEKQTPISQPPPNTPAPWGNADCVHPAPGPNERVPTCSELPLANCENHYYFKTCRGLSGFPTNGVTCASPCGKEIVKLECMTQSGACVPRPGMVCGAPTMQCR